MNKLSSPVLSFLVALLAGLIVAYLCYLTVGMLYLNGVLTYDVSDGMGHGPDEGSEEWQNALVFGIQKKAMLWARLGGIVSSGAVYLFLKSKRKK